jgi:hypothetical protein
VSRPVSRPKACNVPQRGRASLCVSGFLRLLCIATFIALGTDAAAQQSFGRLFFTPEERNTLNDMRNDDVEPQVAAKPVQGETVTAPVVDVISFDGKVERSGGGGTTIWVNGRPVLAGNRTVEGISVYSGRGTSAETRFVLPPSDSGQTDFSLKVGEKIAVQSGKVLDAYEARAAENAESVFAKESPDGSKAAPAEEKAPQDAGKTRAPTQTGGS